VKRVLVALTIVVSAGCGSSTPAPQWTAHADGRLGPLEIDVSSDADVRKAAGTPSKVERVLWPGIRAHTLIYPCGRTCETAYSINDKTGKLSDYWTASPRIRTEDGAVVGMSAARAARLEHKRPHPGCGFPSYLYLRADRSSEQRLFVLAIWKGKIDSIGYLGPHSVYYDGLC
jgi:hypothetical protein